MTEYYTHGLVIDRTNKGELDDSIVLYTKDFGKIIARSKSTKRVESKLSGHLNIGRFIKARIIKSNNYKIVDALSEKTDQSRELFKFIDFINKMTPYEAPDPHLWRGVEYVVRSSLIGEESKVSAQKIYRRFLEILGFGLKFAKCNNCESKEVSYFHPPMLIFLCSDSLKKIGINEDEVVKI